MKNVFFIGIGGIGMSALAKYTLLKGFRCGGSDKSYGEVPNGLKRLGAEIFTGHNAKNVYGYDTVVYSSAIDENNPELKYAKERKLKIYDRAEYLNYIISKHKKVIAVSGSHGKTTATAILSNIYKTANKNFCSFIGGEDKNLTNFFKQGKTEYCITEACEYRKNFLKISFDQGVILNVDTDHPDCYKDYDDVLSAFRTFAKNAYEVVFAEYALKDKFACKKIITFGFDKRADYYASDIDSDFDKIYFSVYKGEKRILDTCVFGFQKNCVLNALASIVVALYNGVSAEDIDKGVKSFAGIKRRNEFLCNYNGCDFYADYCHHPTQIEDTINSFKNITAGRLIVIFQPHTYSRTKALFGEFERVLSLSDRLAVYKTYGARETFDKAGDGKTLSKKIEKSIYIGNEKTLKRFITENCKKNDVCLVLGAGSIYEISKKTLGSLI